MTINRVVRIVAGTLVLTGLGHGAAKSPFFMNENWLWLVAFVGANLFQSGWTNFCPLDKILARIGLKN